MNFNKIGADVMEGYLKPFRVFQIIGDVAEFDTEVECWDYALAKWCIFLKK